MDFALLFSSENGVSIDVKTERFVANGLTPARNYSFRVAAVNIVGRGPFTNPMIVTTMAIGK